MTAPVSRVGRVMASGVLVYRWLIRPLRASAAPTCRYEPTCSAYAVEALTVWGPFRGSWLTLRRLARCQPWGGVGLDPVPSRVPSGAEPVLISRSSARTSG